MNKQMKQHLEAVIEALVEQDSAAAKAAFHDYLRLKSQSILLGESVESEEDDNDDKEDKEEKCSKCDCDPCKCDDKKDDKKKSDKKDDKKKSDEDTEM
jgi:hypothetical protein